MNQIYLVNHKSIYVFLFAYITISLVVTGCKREPKLRDSNIVEFERWASLPWAVDANENLTDAINMYKNKAMDPVPILVYATVGRAIGSEEISILLFVLDEDEDLLGFTVKEESQDPNGTVRILEEDYPIFAHCPAIGVANTYGFRVSARSDKDRKDEKLWAEHSAIDFDAQVQKMLEPLPDLSRGRFSKYDIYTGKIYKFWESSVPPIYISITDSDSTNVKIHIYDKAGNVSNTVELAAKGMD